MSIRGLGDAFAFQRLLWLLVGTVIVPTVLLALYGVVAIRSQRAVFVQQAVDQQEQRLRDVAHTLFEELDLTNARVHLTSAEHCHQPGRCDLGLPLVGDVWMWQTDQPLPRGLVGLGMPDTDSAETTWFTPSDGGDPIGTFTRGDKRFAWRLEMSGIQARVEDLQDAAPGTLALVERRAGPATTFEEMVDQWQEPWFADLALDRPLAGWRLTVSFSDEDPVAPLLARTYRIYLAGLVFLVATVVAGTIITLRSANREIKLSRLQTDFVSSVSHELRTPLTAIRMFVETLQSGRLADNPERVEECLDLLSQETDRLSRMIERVLGYARMESGRRIYELENVEASELIADALRALQSQRLLAEDDLGIEVSLPDHLPELSVDRDAIVEALLNLLQNAVRYTPEPRHILVSADVAGGRVGLSVQDNGPGIAQGERKRIFEKFYQADMLLSRSTQQGSGLGLSIVRAVVRGHGGRVELETEIGRGSCFTLWLPAA